MKKLCVLLVLPVVGFSYDGWTNGYHRSNGTYVQPYQRTAPDHTQSNNYGSQPSTSYGSTNYGHQNTYGSRPSESESNIEVKSLIERMNPGLKAPTMGSDDNE